LAVFESEFSVMDRAAIYICVSHVAATTQKTAGHGANYTKINESQFSCS